MKNRFVLPAVVFVSFLLSGVLIDHIRGDSVMHPVKGKRAVMIIASNNFRDEELLQPKEVMEKNGVTVTVASSSLKESTGMLGAKVKPDILFTEIQAADYDALVFVGGSGANEYWDNPTAHKIANDAHNAKKIVGAICIAPVTLAKAGLLKNKKATTYSSTVKDIQSAGANYTGAEVEKDGSIITASGPAAAHKFGEAIVRELSQ